MTIDCSGLKHLVRFSVQGLALEDDEMLGREGYVRVKEAAEILDVAPNTVRAWGADGRIPEYRHPANNYRLYKRKELEALLKRLNESRRPSTGQKRIG